jgi:hypothetical protein
MYDVITLVKLAREFVGDDLLNAAFDGSQSVDKVSELYSFVVQNFARDTESDVAKKYWQCCATYLASQGLTKEQLQKLRRPYPVYGEPGFKSILDEMREEGWEI